MVTKAYRTLATLLTRSSSLIVIEYVFKLRSKAVTDSTQSHCDSLDVNIIAQWALLRVLSVHTVFILVINDSENPLHPHIHTHTQPPTTQTYTFIYLLPHAVFSRKLSSKIVVDTFTYVQKR